MSRKSNSDDSSSDEAKRSPNWTSGEIRQPSFTDFVTGSTSPQVQLKSAAQTNSGTFSAHSSYSDSAGERVESTMNPSSSSYDQQSSSGAFYEHVSSSSQAEPMPASMISPPNIEIPVAEPPPGGSYYEAGSSTHQTHHQHITTNSGTSTQSIPADTANFSSMTTCTTLPLRPPKLDICQYPVNKDPCPTVIVKHPDQPVHYDQNITIRCLKPPTPPPAPPIVIQEIRPPAPPAAPPIYVRQQPPRPTTPPPLIIRERPPAPPVMPPPKIIHKILAPPPPPPRKVIIEKLPPIPPKPRKVIIEKWLPYPQIKRRIIYQRAPDLPAPIKEKNTIIRWTEPQVSIHKKVEHLGVVRADPCHYMSVHGGQLADSEYVRAAMRHYGVQGACDVVGGVQECVQTGGGNIYYEDQHEIMRLMQGGMASAAVSSSGLVAGGGGQVICPEMGAFVQSDICTPQNFQASWIQDSSYDCGSYYSDPTTYANFYSEPCPQLPPIGVMAAGGMGPIICPDMITTTICQYSDQPGHDPMKCVYCKNARG